MPLLYFLFIFSFLIFFAQGMRRCSVDEIKHWLAAAQRKKCSPRCFWRFIRDPPLPKKNNNKKKEGGGDDSIHPDKSR